jgi:NAD-specific glutamate dehydrogenase
VDPGVASALVVAVGGLVVSLVTNRNNRRGQQSTSEIEGRRVGRDEFDSITRELRESLDDVKKELADERDLRAKSDERAAAADERAKTATAATRRLVRRVEQLENVLRDHDMPVPPPD